MLAHGRPRTRRRGYGKPSPFFNDRPKELVEGPRTFSIRLHLGVRFTSRRSVPLSATASMTRRASHAWLSFTGCEVSGVLVPELCGTADTESRPPSVTSEAYEISPH